MLRLMWAPMCAHFHTHEDEFPRGARQSLQVQPHESVPEKESSLWRVEKSQTCPFLITILSLRPVAPSFGTPDDLLESKVYRQELQGSVVQHHLESQFWELLS